MAPSPERSLYTSSIMKGLESRSTQGDNHKVSFDDGETDNPHNFSTSRKAWVTVQLAALTLTGSLGTSITSQAQSAIEGHFDISLQLTVMTLALFVLGFAFGPIIWAPISEVYGRRWSMLPAVCMLGLFSIGSATSRSPTSLLVTRFFGGVFGSAPNSNATAALGDIYSARTRGVAMIMLSLCVIGGPTVSPVIGSALTSNPDLGWRWTEYAEAIIVFTVFFVTLFCLPETFGPLLLKRKAVSLRRETGDEAYWHPHENEKMRFNNIATKYLSRPLRMLILEPMVTCLAVYAAFVYGLLFLTLEVFPIVFHEDRGWSLFHSSLTSLALFVGGVLATPINLANQPLYIRAVKANKGRPVPEARLPPMMVGCCLFPAGLFMFGWTAAPRYPWPLSVVASAFIGAGFNIVFQQSLNFLVDVYGSYGASAVAATTILRSLLAFGLPLTARPMFRNLGVGPASSLLGGVSCLALPIPFIFKRFGRKLREKSSFAPVETG
ncbi:MAG: hypothetical protein M1828_005638 [Chrysothrix sp. TS-e1954]|nr:MAG: hypothetical protein M1828_005638 [Chrysothrix sp. TS-e1954]